jgi:hypothetical protein
MQKLLRNSFVGFIALSLCQLLAGISHAQAVPVSVSLDRDLGGGRGAVADSSAVPVATLDLSSSSLALMPATAKPPIEPVVSNSKPQPRVNWTGLAKDSFTFLAVMQGFRCATEPGTRAAFSDPFFKGYIRAVQNLHGFADGDPFYVNYVGHPMQGAVSDFIWANNDHAYKDVYFSRDKQYWKEKLRGGAFSYVYSVQFEIGPISEASIGGMQSYYPAQGFVDHVVTPVIGMGWAIGEDAIDRYLVRYVEAQTGNRWIKLLARGTLNPARSFANILGGKSPWYRTNRPGVTSSNAVAYYQPVPVQQKVSPPPGVAPFEFKADSVIRTYLGSNSLGSCVGGGAGVALRIAKKWQIASDVNGCKMTNLPPNASGDSLTYVIGPRWTSQLSPRWLTHAQVLMGGTKVTQEQIDPEKKRATEESMKELGKKGINVWPPPYSQFAHSWDSNAFAIVASVGVDLKFNHALSLRTALDYSHAWNRDLNNINYRNSLQFSSGLVLNMGTW